MIAIEIAYAVPEQQILTTLSVANSTTVKEAILQSDILAQFPEINLAQHKVGIFGKKVALSQILRDGDRIEIYRPLLIDPKQARRQRDSRSK
jgi:putative ubiquitin-RnfH superfamily antitoxin RatB of RatAB toxin-antitoxin module